jgi:hypothetical protein
MGGSEKRTHARIGVRLTGRYLLANRQEHACTVIDGSANGLALLGPEAGAIGETVIVYVEHIGRVEGKIARHIGGGFAIKFTGSRRAAEAFAQLVVQQEPPASLRSWLGRSIRSPV